MIRRKHNLPPRRLVFAGIGPALARTAGILAAAAAIAGCSALTPIEKLVVDRDGGPLLAQIRAGEVGIDEALPWGGVPGMKPSYFTPLCAAAFGGAVDVMGELLALGADVHAECSPAVKPLDLARRHRSHPDAAAMGRLLRDHGADPRPDEDRVMQARL
jgi:hypothetical protein